MKKLTLLGFICMALMLAAIPFMACGAEAPAPVTPAPITSAAGPELFSVLDPRGVEPEREMFALSPRLDTLEGKTVNVINLHGGNEAAFISIAPALQAAVPGCNVVYFRTDGGFGGNPLTEQDLAMMVDCDAAIIGHNFWGGTANNDGRVTAQMEKKGIPCVMESWDDEGMKSIAERAFKFEGVPECRQVFTPPDTALSDLGEYTPDLIDALTIPLTDEEKWSGMYTPPQPPRICMTGTYDEVEAFFEGDLTRFPANIAAYAWMTDGLPIVPPTEEAVARMLEGTSHSPDEVVNPKMRPAELIATVEKVAINAVMAGCKPEYLPVALAIAEMGGCTGCVWDWDFGHMFAVSGPIAKEIGMNSYFQAFTPVGNPANASLTRVGALIGINLGGWEPNVYGIQRIGAHLWGLTIAESEDTPWEGLNVDCGYGANESVLVSFGGYIKVLGACVNEIRTAHNLFELQNGTPEGLVDCLKASKESRNAMVIFTPDTAKVWRDEYGFETVQQLQDYLWDNATRTREDWGSQYWFYMTSQVARRNPPGSRMINPDHLDAPPDALVPQIVNGPEAIKIIVTGGLGTQWGYGGYLFGNNTSIDKWR